MFNADSKATRSIWLTIDIIFFLVYFLVMSIAGIFKEFLSFLHGELGFVELLSLWAKSSVQFFGGAFQSAMAVFQLQPVFLPIGMAVLAGLLLWKYKDIPATVLAMVCALLFVSVVGLFLQGGLSF